MAVSRLSRCRDLVPIPLCRWGPHGAQRAHGAHGPHGAHEPHGPHGAHGAHGPPMGPRAPWAHGARLRSVYVTVLGNRPYKYINT